MSATATNATIETIKIGVEAPLSGSGAELGRMAQAIQLAADEANDIIGAHGSRLQALLLDDESDEDQGVKVAQTFTTNDRVVAVVGHQAGVRGPRWLSVRHCTPGQICSAIGMADEIKRGVPSCVTTDLLSTRSSYR